MSYTKIDEMKEKAAEKLAQRIANEVLVASYRDLLAAGWADADIHEIQTAALEECKATTDSEGGGR